ncbi:hypothetical protein DDF62_21040 [Caulobacter radicis]|uniref:lipoprotein n=1 Tax=Caulobacter radicis TaxID=2172650 RepID=UPI000D57AFE4|nr:lipoprotein [Caulobacter radicis]PVM85021.1 hypothetical protein DDF62_21040 [Caulobacter radicis]
MKKPIVAAGLALLVTACTSSGEGRTTPLPARPTEAEVRDHVAAHWEGNYDAWVPKSAGRPKGRPTLVSVSKLSCRPYYVVWDCEFEIAGRFEDGVNYVRVASAQFDRDAQGGLQAGVLLLETRTR